MIALAVALISLALVAYTAGFVAVMRRRGAVSGFALAALLVGLVGDAAATALMFVLAGTVRLGVHGLLGLLGLVAMGAWTLLVWRHRTAAGAAPLALPARRFGQVAWAFWVVAWFLGASLHMR